MGLPRNRRPDEWREQILSASKKKRDDRSFDRWVIILMVSAFFGLCAFAAYAADHQISLTNLPFLSSTSTAGASVAQPRVNKPPATSHPPLSKPKPVPAATSGPDFGSTNEPVGTPALKVISITSPAQIGQQVSLIVHTVPGALVYPLIYYSPSPVQLQSQVADANGMVTFTWTVLAIRHAGVYHVNVTARLNGQENTVTIPYVVEG